MAEQNRTGPDWADVRVFVALVRHGSLSGAARALGVNHATVARRIDSLETALGEKLVERRPDGYVLTRAGSRVLGPASAMEAAASALGRGGADDAPKGLVRISAPPSLGQGFLVSRLAPLTMRHAGLDLEVATEIRPISLDRREADIALRLGRPGDGDVLARLLVTLGFGFYATPDWCARMADGAEPVFVGFDEVNADLPEALWLRREFPRARISFRSSSHLAQAEAAGAGVGVALVPHFVGRGQARLRPCWLQHAPPSREVWMITRRRDRRELAIRTVVDTLVDIFAAERELFDAG